MNFKTFAFSRQNNVKNLDFVKYLNFRAKLNEKNAA